MKHLALAAACLALSYGFEDHGSIEGRAVNAVSGDGLRKVTLTLTQAGSGEPASTQPDDEGRFAFRDLAPGTYWLAGERSGFRKQPYGARPDAPRAMPIKLSAGQAVKDIVFRMVPSSVISGRVIDLAGEAMPGLMVFAQSQVYTRGARTWVTAGTAQTNDRGEFRIASLKAGRYIVSASNLNTGIGIAAVSTDTGSEQPELGYASTYFGNTLDQARAQAVEAGMGETRTGVDIQMLKAPSLKIRGHLRGGPDAGASAIVALRKSATGGSTIQGAGVVQQSDAVFEIRGLAPGSYLLVAQSVSQGIGRMAAMLPVELADRNILDAEIRMDSAKPLAGVVKMSGKTNKRPTVAVELADYQFAAESAQAGENGEFTLQGVGAGRYRIEVSNLPPDGYVSAIRFGGREFRREGDDLEGGDQKLEIAIARDGARLEGTVKGANGQSLGGATVALIPANRSQPDFREAVAQADGKFEITGIRPGRYLVLAWQEIEAGAHTDPEVVKPVENQGRQVTFEENGQNKLELRAIQQESK